MLERPIRAMVIDPDSDSRREMEEMLRDSGHHVTAVADEREALTWLRETFFDLVLLEPGLNDSLDGLKVLRAIRWRWPKTAVLIATGRRWLEPAIRSIHGRADGYLVKPFDRAELTQAIKEVLVQLEARCADRSGQNILAKAGIVLNRERREVTLDGDRLDLTPTEFEILRHLLESTGRVVSAEELAQLVLGRDDLDQGRRMIRWHIHHLRRKIEPEPSEPRYIVNVYGEGYSFGADGLSGGQSDV